MIRLPFPRPWRTLSRLSTRVAAGLALCLSLVLAAGFGLMLYDYRRTVVHAEREELKRFESGAIPALTHLLQRPGKEGVRDWLEGAPQQPGIRLAQIVGADGGLAFQQATPGDPDPVPPQILDRVLAGEDLFRTDWRDRAMTRLVPLPNGPRCAGCHARPPGQTLGVLRVVGDLDQAANWINGAYFRTAGLGLLATLATVGLGFLLVQRRVLRPVARMAEAAQAWRHGKLKERLEVEPGNELGDLARTLNGMADQLDRTIAENKALITQSQTGMVVVDREGAIQFANPAAESLLGRQAGELEGAPLGVPLVPGETTEIEVWRKGGEPGFAELGVQPITWHGQSAYLVTFHEVTERKRAEQAIRHQAYHDDLTGLANRPHFLDRLGDAISRAEQRGTGLAVLFLDLDRFKAVNDRLGHASGDDLLIEIARRLTRTVRDTDLVARMSGDEFTVLLEDIPNRETAVTVGEKVKHALSEPFRIRGHTVVPGGTVGISFYPEDGADADTLLSTADDAMYQGKESGRNRVQGDRPRPGQATSRRLRMEQALQEAWTRDGLELVYQPQMALPDRRLTSVEALLRWRDPEEGTVSPEDFVPLLEETGLIHDVGEWALVRAGTDLQALAERAPGLERIWINVSGRQLAEGDLLTRMDRSLAASGLTGERFGIELTESSVASDIAHSVEVLTALRQRGFKIAMDDFGKGYSALTFLQQLPMDWVKIDRGFIQDLPQDPGARSLVRAIIGMTHGLGLAVVAEGVETGEQLDWLIAEGCDYAQGFLFARPAGPRQLRVA